MSAHQSQFDNQPLRYYRGHAIYLTAYLTGGLAAGIVLVLLLQSARVPVFPLMFIPGAFLHGMIWQPLTYIFVDRLDFFTPLSLLCFYQWGSEVEKYLGRRQFLAICGALIAGPALLYTAFSFVGLSSALATDFFLVCGLLVAFATLYPNMEYFGWVPLKWFTFVCIACGSLMSFPDRDWVALLALWLNCGAAFAMVRSTQGSLGFRWPKIRWPSPKPKFRVVPRTEPRTPVRATVIPAAEEDDDVDSLLDKIARSGLDSLTTAERARLEKARQDLLRKGH